MDRGIKVNIGQSSEQSIFNKRNDVRFNRNIVFEQNVSITADALELVEEQMIMRDQKSGGMQIISELRQNLVKTGKSDCIIA